MTKEVLAIPEENLEEVIMIIRAGLNTLKASERISKDTETNLEKWCKEEEEYLKKLQEE